MVAAMVIAVEKELVGVAAKDRLVRLLVAYGLPTTARFDTRVVREKMARDKKKSAGHQQWVLPVARGGVEIRTDVDDALIDMALEAVSA